MSVSQHIHGILGLGKDLKCAILYAFVVLLLL